MGNLIPSLFADPLPLVVLGLLGSYIIWSFRAREEPSSSPEPVCCPRCDGTRLIDELDLKTGQRMKVDCPVCHGTGWLAAVTLFTYDKLTRCPGCEAGYFIDVPPGSRYPDGTPMPGSKNVLMACPDCDATGWKLQKDAPAFHSARPWIEDD